MASNFEFSFNSDEALLLTICSKAIEWQRLSPKVQTSYLAQVNTIFNNKVKETMGKELTAQRIVSKAVVEEALNKFIRETYGDGTSQVNTPMRELGNPMEY
jgi:hypothetical protein